MSQKFDPSAKYGRLQPVRPSERKRHWVCRCDCGGEHEVDASNLLAGRTISCGCAHRKHGKTHTREYHAWREARHRCRNPNHHAYSDYGGRGITVCDRWQGEDGFVHFLADMREAPPRHTLERRDNNLGYDVANCYWATRKVQARNRRNNNLLTHDGRTQCMAAWAEELNMSVGAIQYRLRQGWGVEAALATPVRPWRGPRPPS